MNNIMKPEACIGTVERADRHVSCVPERVLCYIPTAETIRGSQWTAVCMFTLWNEGSLVRRDADARVAASEELRLLNKSINHVYPKGRQVKQETGIVKRERKGSAKCSVPVSFCTFTAFYDIPCLMLLSKHQLFPFSVFA